MSIIEKIKDMFKNCSFCSSKKEEGKKEESCSTEAGEKSSDSCGCDTPKE